MKADTMNEKTIELSDDELFAVWDEHYADVVSPDRPPIDYAFFRAIIAASRSRAASEQAGLSLTQEPKYTVNGSAIVNRASGEAIPADEPVFIFRARDKYAADVIGDYAAQFCTDPAHAAAVEARFIQFSEWAEAHPERMKEPDTAPQPASSPVAAEGQKCECGDRPASECDEQWGPNCDMGNNAAHARVSTVDPAVIDAALAAPTASMADAAEAPALTGGEAVSKCDRCGLSPEDHTLTHWCTNQSFTLTPGPRGENAGGVVEALSEEALLEALTGHVKGYITNTVRSIAMDVQRACATAWGLRIAEKGDDRG
jgi:hypothetical protein